MFKKLSFLVFFILISCKQEVKKADIDLLNGYWEIAKVKLPNGKVKEYTINESIDFFEISEGKGFRKKVQPQFDGTFQSNDSQESIQLSDSNNRFYLKYKTNFGKWTEQIVTIQDSVLVLKNDSLTYYYKRFKPLKVN